MPENRADEQVVWDSEEGVMDVMSDISAALNPGDGWRWSVIDLALSGDRAILSDWDSDEYFIAPFTIGADKEPVLSPSTDWTPVESAWVKTASEMSGPRSAQMIRRLRDVASPVERRSVEFTRTEFREQSDKMIFEGRAAVFGEWANIGGQFREQIKRGAFRKSDVTDTVLALNHNYDLVMARTWVEDGPGMLRVEEGTRGLDVYAELAPTQTSRDTKMLVESGVIRQMSFGWPVGATVDTWNDDYTERSITEFKKLLDVSPVVFPAYAGTQASTRSFVDALAESFRPDLPAEERAAAFRAILVTMNPDSPLAAEIAGRTHSHASAGLVAAARKAEEKTARAQRTGQRSALAAFDTRHINRKLRLRGV